MFDTKEYRDWCEKSDFFKSRFKLLLSLTQEFLLVERLDTIEKVNNTYNDLWNVYSACDEIDYESEGQVTAYALIHFLDRYRRFVITFRKLVDKRKIPINNDIIRVMDIGTGPGPALFAISDIYLSMHIFMKEKHGINSFISIETDYVEQSIGFRDWLHHFTEFVNYKQEFDWIVPYHHGSVRYIDNLSFSKEKQSIDERYLKSRFNLLIFSNVLTQEHQVNKWKEMLDQCITYLKHKGLVVIVGGKGDKYKSIYEKVKDIFLTDRPKPHYLQWVTIRRQKFKNKRVRFDFSDEYGSAIKEFFRKVFAHMENISPDYLISDDLQKRITAIKSDNPGKPKTWRTEIYRKTVKVKSSYGRKRRIKYNDNDDFERSSRWG